MTDFGSFSLDKSLLKALRETGILVPSYLQQSVIPEIQKGRDVLIDAVPGKGRTLSFAIPIFGKIIDSEFKSRAIILTVSQETSFEIANKLRKLARLPGVKIQTVSSGIEHTDAKYDFFKNEEDFPHILIGQPPSVIHFVDGTKYDMSRVDSLLVVVDSKDHDSDFEKTVQDITSRIKEECQRILITSKTASPPYDLIEQLLRSPAIIYDASSARDEREGEKPTSEKSDAIDHRLYMLLKKPTREDLLDIIRSESAGMTLIVVEDKQEAVDLCEQLKSRLSDIPVNTLRDFDSSKPLPEPSIILSDKRLIGEASGFSFNVIILKLSLENYEDYFQFLGMLKGKYGDKIVTLATGRDIGAIFNIKAQFGIKMKEILPPSAREIQTEKETEIIGNLARTAAEPDEYLMSLLRRVKMSPFEDKILAESLKRLLKASSGSEEAAPPVYEHKKAESGGRPSRSPQARVSETGGIAKFGRSKGHRPSMVELKLNAGEDDGLESGFLIQWLQSRLAMRASEFGPIHVLSGSSTIFVPQDRAEDAVIMLNGLRFGDKIIEVNILPSRQTKRK